MKANTKTSLMILWACSLITFVTVYTWVFTPTISGGTATALATVFALISSPGIPAIVDLWKKKRQEDKDNEATNESNGEDSRP